MVPIQIVVPTQMLWASRQKDIAPINVESLKLNQIMIRKKIILDSETKIDLIDIEKITYIVLNSTNTEIHLITGDKYFSSKTLAFFESSVPDNVLFKINRNTIVNLSYIASINKLTRKITIESDVSLCVSARQLKILIKRLKPILIRSSTNS
ncbi:MAG TPA: LytTR family DNA-binding domain-containing protein [Paludibacteraceae bacterium]|nr:LytTR family DNA-binding domain-containing protein [Paludibacteraceae bacterium]